MLYEGGETDDMKMNTSWAGFGEGTQHHNSTHMFLATQVLGSGDITEPKWQRSYMLDMFWMSEEVKLRRWVGQWTKLLLFLFWFFRQNIFILVLRDYAKGWLATFILLNFCCRQTEATESWSRTTEFRHFFHFRFCLRGKTTKHQKYLVHVHFCIYSSS